MGCFVSTPKDGGGNRRRPSNIGEVSVYVPGLRIPKAVDFSLSLGYHLSKSLVERLLALWTRIVFMVGQEGPTITRARRRTATQHWSPMQHKVPFETAMYSAWYEVLSVLHLMATLALSQANLLFLPRTSNDECRRSSVDVFLKAAGYLDCVVRHVLPQMPNELRYLFDGVDIQLGLAIDGTKATLPVKRRLACEMAQDNIMNLTIYRHVIFLDSCVRIKMVLLFDAVERDGAPFSPACPHLKPPNSCGIENNYLHEIIPVPAALTPSIFYLLQYENCIKDCDRAVERGRELRSDYKMLNDAFKAKKDLDKQEYFDPQIADEEREKGTSIFVYLDSR
ncbi:hypothetical protein ACJIZ3_006304 [Penstemon smallii]|uniref:BRO1 domain-containing protein n=1 Tax=Penstemon smallii TaxID=265156 RepID=A0ABD3S799_9LAMI